MKDVGLRNGRSAKVNHVKTKKKIKSEKLTSRIQLTDDQYERAKKQAPNGEIAKFDPITKRQSLVLIRKLSLARKKAGKFVLVNLTIGRTMYVADRQILGKSLMDGELPLTFNKDEALTFLEGFDNPLAKISYYAQEYKLPLQSARI